MTRRERGMTPERGDSPGERSGGVAERTSARLLLRAMMAAMEKSVARGRTVSGELGRLAGDMVTHCVP